MNELYYNKLLFSKYIKYLLIIDYFNIKIMNITNNLNYCKIFNWFTDIYIRIQSLDKYL